MMQCTMGRRVHAQQLTDQMQAPHVYRAEALQWHPLAVGSGATQGKGERHDMT